MKMTEAPPPAAQAPIDGYAPSGFRVSGRFFDGPIVLGPDGVAAWRAPLDVASLGADAAADLAALAGVADVLIIGVGPVTRRPPAAFADALAAAGLRFDAMDTGAACRTYNVLLAEDRRVAATLLPGGAP